MPRGVLDGVLGCQRDTGVKQGTLNAVLALVNDTVWVLT